MMKELSVDASSITLTVVAFVEIDIPTTVPKMITDDRMIINDLVANSGVTSLSSLRARLRIERKPNEMSPLGQRYYRSCAVAYSQMSFLV